MWPNVSEAAASCLWHRVSGASPKPGFRGRAPGEVPRSARLCPACGRAARESGRALGPGGAGRLPRYLKPGPMPPPAPLCAPAGAAQEERSAATALRGPRGDTCSRQPGQHASSGTRSSPAARRSPLCKPLDLRRASAAFWILALDAESFFSPFFLLYYPYFLEEGLGGEICRRRQREIFFFPLKDSC